MKQTKITKQKGALQRLELNRKRMEDNIYWDDEYKKKYFKKVDKEIETLRNKIGVL